MTLLLLLLLLFLLLSLLSPLCRIFTVINLKQTILLGYMYCYRCYVFTIYSTCNAISPVNYVLYFYFSTLLLLLLLLLLCTEPKHKYHHNHNHYQSHRLELCLFQTI